MWAAVQPSRLEGAGVEAPAGRGGRRQQLPEVRDLEEVPDPVARDEEDARQRAFDDAHLRFSFLRRG